MQVYGMRFANTLLCLVVRPKGIHSWLESWGALMSEWVRPGRFLSEPELSAGKSQPLLNLRNQLIEFEDWHEQGNHNTTDHNTQKHDQHRFDQ